MDDQYQPGSSSYEDPSADEQRDYSTDDTPSRGDDVFLNIAKSSVSSRRDSLGRLDRRRVSVAALSFKSLFSLLLTST